MLEVVWLLVRIPLAARAADFAAALGGCGMHVGTAPELADVTVAFGQAVDARMPDGKGLTDLAEMAHAAGVETINAVVGDRAASLWGAGPDEVRRAFAALATPPRFGPFARRFFARFSFKCISYFVSRALPGLTGEGKRFRTVEDQARFVDGLRDHCHEASRIVEEYAGDWFSKERFESAGDITREKARAFLGFAVRTKLTGEFRRREGRRGA